MSERGRERARRCAKPPPLQPTRRAVMLNRDSGIGALGLLVAIGLVAAGCAGSAAGVRPTGMPGPQDLGGYAYLRLDVTKADGVEVGSAETERITKRIVEAIEKKQPGRFKSVN